MKKGEVYWADLDPTFGTEIKKTRPVIIVSNDVHNKILPRVIIAPITSNVQKVSSLQVLIQINGKDGKILIDQIRSIDKSRISSKICNADTEIMPLINKALKIVFGIY